MNVRELKRLHGQGDEALGRMCDAWRLSGDNSSPIRSLRGQQRGSRIRFRCFILIVFGLFFGMVEPLRPSFAQKDLWIAVLWCFALTLIPSILYLCMAKCDLETLIKRKMSPTSSVARFIVAITLIEKRLGPLSEYNERWSSEKLIAKAAKRSALDLFERVMDLQEANHPEAKNERDRAIKILRDLASLSRISSDEGHYFSRSLIESERNAERVEPDLEREADGRMAFP